MGDGPDRPRIEKLCRETGYLSDIRFLGKLEAVEEVLSISDLFLMPSEKESFGLAALEAMACEVPVVSTNAGGIPELNVDGVTGTTSAVGDVADMVQKRLCLFWPTRTCPRFKATARARAEEFAVEKIVPLYEACYQRAIDAQLAAV